MERVRMRVYVRTFGCQMNDHDSGRMVGLLKDEGWERVGEPLAADLVIINTCSVRGKSEDKAYSEVGRVLADRGRAERPLVVFAGCVAQQAGRRVWARLPGVDLVLGPSQIGRLPELVGQLLAGRRGLAVTEGDHAFVPLPQGGPFGVRAFVTIMKGCNNRCAYCIVPSVRGPEVSRPPEDVEEEVRRLVEGGVSEVILLGQNVNSYRRGQGGGFAGLLERLAGVEGLARIRFTTSHPKDMPPALADAMGRLDPVCEHLHFPVQSGSDRVLGLMNRGYDRDTYLRAVEMVRRAVPHVALSTDIIVGFPGEEEDDFEASLSLLREVGYDSIFSFCYSSRPATAAASLRETLTFEEKKHRLRRLQDLQADLGQRRAEALVGRRMEVLVEGGSLRGEGQAMGRTRCNRVVNFAPLGHGQGRIAEVLIEEALSNSLRGREVESQGLEIAIEGYIA